MPPETPQQNFLDTYLPFGINSGTIQLTNSPQLLPGAVQINSRSVLSPSGLTAGDLSSSLTYQNGDFQSSQFVSGSAGWRIRSNGDVEFNNGTFRGTLTASSIAIPDSTTANSFHVDTQGNTWWGATTIGASVASVTKAGAATFSNITITGGSLSINGNSMISSTGFATFKGVSSLNMKAYTDFETAGRFVLTGDVSPTFGNQGMLVAPGATATHYARGLWYITTTAFSNNPTFTTSMLCPNPGFNVASGSGRAFVGLGAPTISGSGITGTGKNYTGFLIQKDAGACTVAAQQCDGSGSATGSATLTTLTDGDVIEFYIKMNAASIDYYYRKNGGTLTGPTTLTGTMPSGGENNISFMSSNASTATDFQIQFQTAAYEH